MTCFDVGSLEHNRSRKSCVAWPASLTKHGAPFPGGAQRIETAEWVMLRAGQLCDAFPRPQGGTYTIVVNNKVKAMPWCPGSLFGHRVRAACGE